MISRSKIKQKKLRKMLKKLRKKELKIICHLEINQIQENNIILGYQNMKIKKKEKMKKNKKKMKWQKIKEIQLKIKT